MSEWYEPKEDDIEIDKVRKEVDIFVKQDDFGSVYVTLTFIQVKSLADEIAKEDKP